MPNKLLKVRFVFKVIIHFTRRWILNFVNWISVRFNLEYKIKYSLIIAVFMFLIQFIWCTRCVCQWCVNQANSIILGSVIQINYSHVNVIQNVNTCWIECKKQKDYAIEKWDIMTQMTSWWEVKLFLVLWDGFSAFARKVGSLWLT